TNGVIRVVSSVPGDYNADGVVDAADYTVWRDTLGLTTDLRADGNGDGIVNQLDYQFWVDQFPHPGAGSAGVGAVPEPSTAALLAIGCTTIIAARRQLR